MPLAARDGIYVECFKALLRDMTRQRSRGAIITNELFPKENATFFNRTDLTHAVLSRFLQAVFRCDMVLKTHGFRFCKMAVVKNPSCFLRQLGSSRITLEDGTSDFLADESKLSSWWGSSLRVLSNLYLQPAHHWLGKLRTRL